MKRGAGANCRNGASGVWHNRIIASRRNSAAELEKAPEDFVSCCDRSAAWQVEEPELERVLDNVLRDRFTRVCRFIRTQRKFSRHAAKLAS